MTEIGLQIRRAESRGMAWSLKNLASSDRYDAEIHSHNRRSQASSRDGPGEALAKAIEIHEAKLEPRLRLTE